MSTRLALWCLAVVAPFVTAYGGFMAGVHFTKPNLKAQEALHTMRVVVAEPTGPEEKAVADHIRSLFPDAVFFAWGPHDLHGSLAEQVDPGATAFVRVSFADHPGGETLDTICILRDGKVSHRTIANRWGGAWISKLASGEYKAPG